MNRLTTIIINNNYVAKIGNVGENVPNMKCLVLTNNRIIHLSEIDNISSFKKLEHLSLLENPVTIKQNYRDYIIYKIPSLKSLDFKKISMKEREQSKKFMKSNLGVLLLASISNEQTDSNETNGNGKKIVPAIVLTDEQKALVRAAIENAKTREDVEIIEKHLKVRIMVEFELTLFFCCLPACPSVCLHIYQFCCVSVRYISVSLSLYLSYLP